MPAFCGLYAPRWHSEARGVIVGLTSFIHRGHLARAVLEATAWQTQEVLDVMNRDSGLPVTRLKVDGGMTANHLLMQSVADVLDVPVERPLGSEAVSLGAAYAAGLAVGYWPDMEVLRHNWHRAAAWEPDMDPALRRSEHEKLGPGGGPQLRVGAPAPDRGARRRTLPSGAAPRRQAPHPFLRVRRRVTGCDSCRGMARARLSGPDRGASVITTKRPLDDEVTAPEVHPCPLLPPRRTSSRRSSPPTRTPRTGRCATITR